MVNRTGLSRRTNGDGCRSIRRFLLVDVLRRLGGRGVPDQADNCATEPMEPLGADSIRAVTESHDLWLNLGLVRRSGPCRLRVLAERFFEAANRFPEAAPKVR
jgi:hypothetical protein